MHYASIVFKVGINNAKRVIWTFRFEISTLKSFGNPNNPWYGCYTKAINKDHVNYMVLPLHVDKIWMPLETKVSKTLH
jgi:hypothetical protein